MGRHFTEEQWREYDAQGFLKLGKVLSDDELHGLRTRIDAIMLGRIRYRDMMMQLDLGGGYDNTAPQSKGWKGETLEYRKIEQLEKDPLFLAFMQKPVFREACDLIYGAHADIAAYRAMFMNKPARLGTVLPYHQDGGDNWQLDRDPLLTVWTALDPATKANGCVKVFPGTHRLGLVSKFGHTLSAENIARYCPEEKVVHVELEPGEAYLMHNWLIHGSDINNTDIPRRGFSVCYIDARTTHLPSGSRFPVVFGENAIHPEEPETVAV
jgi:phytanoyl-CoA hydroxylase